MAWIGLVVAGIGQVASSLGQGAARKEQKRRLNESRDFVTKGPINDFVQGGVRANTQTNDLLGLGGDDPASVQNSRTAFDKYLGSTGYQFQVKQGQNAITSNAASRGLLDSGATAKSLVKYGQDIGSSYFDRYLTQLGGVANRGLQAATVQSNAYSGASTALGNAAVAGAEERANSINDFAGQASDFIGFEAGRNQGTPSTSGGDASNTAGIFNGVTGSNGPRRAA